MDQQTRRLVRERAGGRCEYCLISEDDDTFAFHVEHIVSQKHGGADEEDNLAFACQNCNLHKGANLSGVDPVTEEVTTLFHPRDQSWGDHFRQEGAEIVGLTATGRATARVLNMNDQDRVELRRSLGYSDDFG